MARAIESWFICDGRYRIHSVKSVGRHPERIIEIEDVEQPRLHGSGADLERLAFSFVGESPSEIAKSLRPGILKTGMGAVQPNRTAPSQKDASASHPAAPPFPRCEP